MEIFESGIHQVFVKLLDGKHRVLNFNGPLISVPALKSHIQALTSIPSDLQLLRLDNSRVLLDDQTLKLSALGERSGIQGAVDFVPDAQLPRHQSCSRFRDGGFPARVLVNDGSGELRPGRDREIGNFPVVVHLLLRLRGGKGGFGSLLRGAATKAGQKKTNNFDACRDMNGRRLRHVNAEKKLEEWRAEADERKLERMAEEYLKKKLKEVAKSGKSKAGDSAEKYVAKYREDSAKCMEEVERSVRESIKGSASFKRKGGAQEADANQKRLKIWLGKRKLAESDSEDSEEDETEREENAKSVVTDNDNHSDSSKEAEETSDIMSGGNPDAGSLDRGSPVSQEKDIAGDSPKSDHCQDGLGGDGKDLSVNKPTLESFDEIMPHNGAEVETSRVSLFCVLKEITQEPVVSVPEEVVSSVAEVSDNIISEPVEQGSISMNPKVEDLEKPLNFDLYNSAAELEVLGMEMLKSELQSRGLKCGGTLHERAARLFMLKTTPLERLPKKLFCKK